MNAKENLHQKQEKLFRVLFVVMCLLLGALYYQAFCVRDVAASGKTAACSDETRTLCVLGPGHGKAVDALVPGLCCQNRK